MNITAKQIAAWAATKDAQASLPRYIRRLIHDVGSITQVSIPAGDSTSQPGWDGELTSATGNAWVPSGKSFWEMSCDGKVAAKASRDYIKRTRQTPEDVRRQSVLVVVTGRQWRGKKKWQSARRISMEWKDVLAYDADSIEHWLEETPAVRLQFGDEIGLSGVGVADVERYWRGWAEQSEFTITPGALFSSREGARDSFIAAIRSRLESRTSGILTVRGDSVEEVTAFACAALMAQPDLLSSSVVVTEVSGWRFVEQNTTLRVAVSAKTEVAAAPPSRPGTIIVVPYAAGDVEGAFLGVAGREGKSEITLERPDLSALEKALAAIGEDEGDARRVAVVCGRSWSVYRRSRAKNPAIRQPSWLDAPEARALSTLCLLGSWSGDNERDRRIVSELSGRNYEDIERDLRSLSQVDDAPILEIGEVWKAKSALELLMLFGSKITRAELDRFFPMAVQVLSVADPILELPEDKRHAAQIYGKVRLESGLLLRAICGTLVKLSVRGPDIRSLLNADISGRVSAVVAGLLRDADGTRWLSLSSYLPDLAEAAPEAFMAAVERSLSRPDVPVTRLLTETTGSGLFGRCWHAGLLWGFERLAWAPQRLARVSLVLARLSGVEIKGNWGNRPDATLLSLFRVWFPQTSASVEQRIAALDVIIARVPSAAFDLLDSMTNLGPRHAALIDRPNWRDDDAGAIAGVPRDQEKRMLFAAADRMLAMAAGNPARLAKLPAKIFDFDDKRAALALSMIRAVAADSSCDGDKEPLRTALREHIHWRVNFGESEDPVVSSRLAVMMELYVLLEPADLVLRSRWLFSEHWPNLPEKINEHRASHESESISKSRADALMDIFHDRGVDGFDDLISVSNNGVTVGCSLANIVIQNESLAEWFVGNGEEFIAGSLRSSAIASVLRTLPSEREQELVTLVLGRCSEERWSSQRISRFLALCRHGRWLWQKVSEIGADVENEYWSNCAQDVWCDDGGEELEWLVCRLLSAKRPRSAFRTCYLAFGRVDPILLAEMLEGILQGQEADGPAFDAHHLARCLEALEKSGKIETGRLIQIEFGCISGLSYGEEHRARTLYNAVMSDPALFCELICLQYRPSGQPHDERKELTDKEIILAACSRRVLQHCRQLPGTRSDGTVDGEKFSSFIEEARRLCGTADRQTVGDLVLGEIMAHVRPDIDGSWPPIFCCDVLDRPELGRVREGFVLGVLNKRGMVGRAHNEGGEQERELANTFRKQARSLCSSHVNVSAMLDELASSYEVDGRRVDIDARLSREHP